MALRTYERRPTTKVRKNVYFDKHTLNIGINGFISKEAIERAIEKCVKEASKILGCELSSECTVNVIKDKCAFVFVNDERVYYILIGFNPDGSERVKEIIKNEPLTTEEHRELEYLEGMLEELCNETGSIKRGVSWADVAEIEDRIIELQSPKKVIVNLEPIVTLKVPIFSDEDLRRKDLTTKFEVGPSFVKQLEPCYERTKLFCTNVPAWISEMDIHKLFHCFCTTRNTKTIKENKEVIEKAYPIVKITSDRKAFVEFDPLTHDAQFAKIFRMFTPLRKRIRGIEQSVLLKFDHPRCNILRQ
jgi:hypothetical protein